MAEIVVGKPLSRAATTLPLVRQIGVSDVRAALAAGVDDFLAVPTQLVFLCILYPIVGFVAARAAFGTNILPLLFPLVAGISLLGPVLAVGIYELSRRRELGLAVSWTNAFDVLQSAALPGIVVVGVLLLALFTAWIEAARLIYIATVGPMGSTSAGALAATLLDTSAGWHLALLGNLVGLAFAIVVLTLTVVSVPMLLDRNVSPVLAVQTSVRAVLANPVPLAAWGLIVAVTLLLGCLPLFTGLAVAMPVLGHGTWHLYRRLIA